MKKRINYKILLFCFLISLVVLFFTSKSSPFYPFNDWVDANAFLTVGKSMAKGIIPYKELFEQKGPVLYFIFMLASLISNTSFIGVFFFEIIFMTFTLYFCYLIAKMFLDNKTSVLLLPVFLLLLTTTGSFTHGASCEEFMFLWQAITIYYFIRHFKKKEMNYKEFILVGFLSGLVLLIKYTSLGMWFAFQMIMFFSYIGKKEYKKSILSCIYFLIGMIIPLVISLIYFGINGGIKDFINVYFVVNMTSYGKSVSLIEKPYYIFKTFFNTLINNSIPVIFLTVIYPILVFKLSLEKKEKIYLIIVFLFTIIGVFFGLKGYVYYVLPVVFFIIISLIAIAQFINKKYLTKNYKLIMSIILVLTFLGSYLLSNNRYFHEVNRKDLFQYQFAKEINKDLDATVVNMGFLDCGVYTLSNLYPTTYFFEQQNFNYDDYPNNIDAFRDYIINKETKYIVYIKQQKDETFIEEENLFKNYDMIIGETKFHFEEKDFYAFLWKVRE